MANITTRNPIFDTFFNEIAPNLYVRPLHGEGLPQPQQIKINVSEKDDTYYVSAEIPGVAKENIDLTVSGEVVTISAELNQHDEQREGDKVLRSERYSGSMSRSFQLPEQVNTDAVEASYENGVLKLVLPKLANVHSKKIAIK